MNFKELFPVLDTCTYLNTASSGIMTQSMYEWRKSHDLDFLSRGSSFRLNQAEYLQEVKHQVANFFHTKTERTFLTPNFSFAFNTFLEGLSGTQRFLLLQEDYPSINYPVKSRGFISEIVPVNEFLEQNILEKIKSFKPTILAISIVQYINGIKISLDFLKELKAMFPGLLIVADGTQFCGTEYFDFEASGLDVLIASGYKWMLGGYGNGFICIKEQVAGQLYQDAQKSALPTEPFLLERGILSLYFEPGHQDTLAFGSLSQSISFLNTVGFDFIESKIKLLSEKAKAAFAARGLLDPTVTARETHSSIFNLSIQGNLVEKLQQANIMFSPRGKGIRVSFHFYNTEQELNHLLEVLDQH